MYNENTTGGVEFTHAKVPLAPTVVHASHPFKHAGNHAFLLKYLQQRLIVAKNARDQELPRFVRIDKNISGWMKKSDEDVRRDSQKDRDGSPQATAMNLPLAYVHIDDMMTYFAQTFAPSRGMFYHTGKPGETDDASQITTLMNNQAIYAGYYREVLLGIHSILKYNRGGYRVTWAKEQGPKLSRGSDGKDAVDMQLRWEGNRLEAIDMYNFLPDPSVHPSKLHCDGEFFAHVKMRSFYWLQNKANQGEYFNCDAALQNYAGTPECRYYRSPPREAQFDQDESSGMGSNWISILSEVPTYGGSTGFELAEIEIRLNPTEFGLLDGGLTKNPTRNRYEIWRFTVLNDNWIIAAEYMDNIHGYLSAFLGLLNDDLMGTAQKGVAEILQPLQDFASFLINIHIEASRSAIYGLTVYDPSIVDLKKIPKGEVNANIPMSAAGFGKDVGTAIKRFQTTMDTNQTMQDLEGVMGIINGFFPTQSLPSQIASIDRAVDSQVAAVQQGANRRQQKAARLLDDSVFRNVRFAMYYNIIQKSPDTSEVTDYYTGKPVKIDLTSLRNTDLPFIIGQGLKAIDRQAAAQSLQQIIFALIQAPQAAQGIDLLGLIDYWTTMIDIDIDMKTFERVAPPEAQAELAVDASGNSIQPATNPQAVTQPIYGRKA